MSACHRPELELSKRESISVNLAWIRRIVRRCRAMINFLIQQQRTQSFDL